MKTPCIRTRTLNERIFSLARYVFVQYPKKQFKCIDFLSLFYLVLIPTFFNIIIDKILGFTQFWRPKQGWGTSPELFATNTRKFGRVGEFDERPHANKFRQRKCRSQLLDDVTQSRRRVDRPRKRAVSSPQRGSPDRAVGLEEDRPREIDGARLQGGVSCHRLSGWLRLHVGQTWENGEWFEVLSVRKCEKIILDVIEMRPNRCFQIRKV